MNKFLYRNLVFISPVNSKELIQAIAEIDACELFDGDLSEMHQVAMKLRISLKTFCNLVRQAQEINSIVVKNSIVVNDTFHKRVYSLHATIRIIQRIIDKCLVLCRKDLITGLKLCVLFARWFLRINPVSREERFEIFSGLDLKESEGAMWIEKVEQSLVDREIFEFLLNLPSFLPFVCAGVHIVPTGDFFTLLRSYQGLEAFYVVYTVLVELLAPERRGLGIGDREEQIKSVITNAEMICRKVQELAGKSVTHAEAAVTVKYYAKYVNCIGKGRINPFFLSSIGLV